MNYTRTKLVIQEISKRSVYKGSSERLVVEESNNIMMRWVSVFIAASKFYDISIAKQSQLVLILIKFGHSRIKMELSRVHVMLPLDSPQ